MFPLLTSSLCSASIGQRLIANSNSGALKQIPKFFPNTLFAGVKTIEPDMDLDHQVRYRSNRSRRGLYNGKDIRTGNNVSFSMKKTKRKFKPNVFKKSVYSEILDEMIRFHLTASTLRSIDKAGGLDNYLLTSKYVTEGEGLVAKKRILNRIKLLEKKNGVGNALENIVLDKSRV